MENILETTSALHLTLKGLIEKKARRDGSSFSIYQLAQALEMPRSILVRLMHPDPGKRVTNPRIDTLLKIVTFFKADGFDVSVDDLLYLSQGATVDIESQSIDTLPVTSALPLYSFNTLASEHLGSVDIPLNVAAGEVIALCCDEDIKPMFKKGSIFIIDKQQKPEHDHLVAVKLKDHARVLIRKYYIKGNQHILRSYHPEEDDIILLPTLSYQLLGVVIQVNAKT